MIPTSLSLIQKTNKSNNDKMTARLGDKLFTQYTWLSEDRKVVVTVTKGYQNIGEGQIVDRLQDYYSIYKH